MTKVAAAKAAKAARAKEAKREARFFRTAAAWRAWLEEHHADASEIWIGFYKAGSEAAGRAMEKKDAVDEALAFGWIDGILQSLGDDAYRVRFTPRKRGSIWSAVNLRRIEELIREGRVTEAGLATYRGRDPKKAALYSFERAHASLGADEEKAFRRNAKAWAYFSACPAGYRKVALHWVTTAKRADTREKRLAELVRVSAAGERLAFTTKWSGKEK